MTRGQTKDKILRRDALPVPQNLPVGTRCIQMEIPDDDEYELQFYSVLRLLTKWNSYQQDGAHKAADVAYIWKQVLSVTSVRACEVLHSGVEIEEMSRFRIDPDNNCILQIECAPDEWETFWDISTCVVDNIKQATNGAPLSDGECREWDVSLNGNGKWLIPVSVSAGDIITVTEVDGAWNMGTLAWNCPSGELYVLGECEPSSGSLNSGNPFPTALTGTLLMEIGSSFYGAYNVELSVPGGVTDAQVAFQANDINLGDNSGTIKFHVKLCRPAPVLTPITLSYVYGSGPASLDPTLDEWIIGISSQASGGVQGHVINVTISDDFYLTVLSQSGFIDRTGSAGVTNNIFYLAGTSVDHTVTPNDPTHLTAHTHADKLLTTTGNNTGTPTAYSVQLKIQRT